MRAVDVGVAHHHDLAVPPLGRVFLLADAVADGRDDVADLLVAEHAVEPGPLDVEDLAAEREDRLVEPVAAPLGGPAGRVALDQEQLAGVLVVGGAVHQLAGQPAAGEDPLAVADQLAGLAGRLAGLGGQLGLGDDLLGRRRVGLQELGQLLVDDPGDDPLDLAVAQLGLGLALELRVGHADADDRRQAFLEVLAGDRQVLVLGRAPPSWRTGSGSASGRCGSPVRWVPPSTVLMLLQYETTISLIESLYCKATSTSTARSSSRPEKTTGGCSGVWARFR